jgi:hypothetical protein
LTLIQQESGGIPLDTGGVTDFWDAQSHPLRNLTNGTEDSDDVTVEQLAEAVFGDLTSTHFSSHIDLDESAPGAPAANVARVHARDAGGATVLSVIDSAGVAADIGPVQSLPTLARHDIAFATDYSQIYDASGTANKKALSLPVYQCDTSITAAQLNTLLVALATTGGALCMGPGTYGPFSTQVAITVTGPVDWAIHAYGVEITTTGAIAGFKVINHFTPHVWSIDGMKVNHRGNASATAGFHLTGTNHGSLRNPVVEMHGVGASYRPYLVENITAADNDTGNFWTTIDGARIRKRSGADSGDATVGIELRGAANATRILGGSISNCTDAILITHHSGQTYMANGVQILGMAFEGGITNAIRVTAPSGSPSSYGLVAIGCRFESLTNCYRFDGGGTYRWLCQCSSAAMCHPTSPTRSRAPSHGTRPLA